MRHGATITIFETAHGVRMRITIQAVVDREDGLPPETFALGGVQREPGCDPSCGLGLFVRETYDMLQRLQSVVLKEQTAVFLNSAASCQGSGKRLTTKTTRSLVYRTAFGNVSLDSPQLYSRCSHCGVAAYDGATFNPLAVALPERSHPQWVWLQCRYASDMSYRLARIILRDAFPGGADVAASSVKLNVRAIGERLGRRCRNRSNAPLSHVMRSRCQLVQATSPSRSMRVTSSRRPRSMDDGGSPASPRRLFIPRWVEISRTPTPPATTQGQARLRRYSSEAVSCRLVRRLSRCRVRMQATSCQRASA